MISKLPCLFLIAVAIITYSNATTTTASHVLETDSILLETSFSGVDVNLISEEGSTDFHSEQNTPNYKPLVGMVENPASSPIQRVRLRFSAEDGLRRPLLLGFTPDNAATDGFDYGYDALNVDQFPNDMFWNINGENYVIQGVGAFDYSKAYPLNVIITNAGLIKIALTGLENFDAEIDVFVYDSLLNIYTQINSVEYEITLEAEIYENRFFIAFSSDDALLTSDGDVLSVTNHDEATIQISFFTGSSEIYLKSLDLVAIEKVHLVNIIGQTIMTWNKKELNNTGSDLRIPVDNIPDGTYIIKVETFNTTINKKAIIN